VDDGSNDHLHGSLDAALGNDLFLVAEDLGGTKIRVWIDQTDHRTIGRDHGDGLHLDQ
jgi:hypothetical protein